MRTSITVAISAACLTAVGCQGRGQRLPADSAQAAVRAESTAPAALGAPITPLAARRPADGTHRFALSMRKPGDTVDAPLGTMTVEQTTLASPGGRVIRRVITYDYGTRGVVIDTTLSNALTLMPISERTHKLSTHAPPRTIVEDFRARVVTGRMGPADSMRVIDDTLPAPAFNSTDAELVVRSMPLRLGLRTSIPIYDPEGPGFRRAEVRVDSIETMRRPGAGAGPRPVWVVHMRGTVNDVVYRVDTLTRALVASDIQQLPRGARFRLVATGA